MNLISFEPEIPQNAGTLARLCRCFNIGFGIIEPASFLLESCAFMRAGMDYVDIGKIIRYKSFEQLVEKNKSLRIVLLDTKAKTNYYEVTYKKTDVFIVGRESSGVPEFVYNKADIPVKIPMAKDVRSLNVAISASIVLAEAMRQFGYDFSRNA